MFNPNVNALVPAVMTPSSARANVDPMTGWPAKGISPPRPKMRSLISVPGRSAGNTNVASEKLVSRVMTAIASAVNPSVSRKTASWLPVSGRSVKTSYCKNRRPLATAARLRD